MSIFVLSSLFFGFGFLILGIFVFLKRKDALGRVWLFYSLCCGFWGIGFAYQLFDYQSYSMFLISSRFADGVAAFIPLAWLRFLWIYLGLKENKKLFVVLAILSGIIFLSFPTPFFIAGAQNKTNIGFEYFVKGGPLFHVFAGYFFLTILFGFYLVLKKMFNRECRPVFRKHLAYLCVASLFGFSAGGAAFLPVYDIDVPVKYASLFLQLEFWQRVSTTKFEIPCT